MSAPYQYFKWHVTGTRSTVADEWMARIAEWNKTLDPAGRYQAVMAAPGLFEVTVTP